ncbi:hypothetical protein SAMN06265337_3051 [Hymenobacter gelipurpurascens]|uniref:Dolichyl-phosphate-mannose-protein mannosyltransferase n=1 Tax=Hymenobacter gelipurpurascens TaxID=89968 RepID=A0A212UC96_9BACT|nr:hypothetical protein [Hymenobacter gelipurpurascens]SNC75780.1 hypothetical protein SAMN06265337_3051 [Hymenobacter gelipurpurascens]
MKPFTGMLRQVVGCTLLILLVTVSFLFSPPPRTNDVYCGTYLHLTAYAGFTDNCDSGVYIENARHPARLLEPNEVRQSRPLFILLGTAVGYPCTWVLQLLSNSERPALQFLLHVPTKYQLALGFYVGYVLLNYVVLLGSLLLFIALYGRLTQGQGSRVVLGGLLVFLVSNPVTKAFFWTVHQQMFTFFTPLFCLYLLIRLNEKNFSGRMLVSLALGTGSLCLVYGSFVLGLPCLLVALYFWRKSHSPTRLWVLGGAVSSAFLLPTVLWIAGLRLFGIHYYNHEVKTYRQFIWLKDALLEPDQHLYTSVVSNLAQFGTTLPAIMGFLSGALALYLWFSWRQARTGWRELELPGQLTLGLLTLFTVFFALLGFYQGRLTFTLVPLVLCFIGCILHRIRLPQLSWGVVAVAFLWHCWQVVAYGPYS